MSTLRFMLQILVKMLLPAAIDPGHGDADPIVGAQHAAGGLGAGDGEGGEAAGSSST